MPLLLDENTWPDLENRLAAHGIAALHVKSLGLDGRGDPEIFRFALANGYDAIITKDAYRKAVQVHALRAMRDGLRIFRARFTPKDPLNESPQLLADLVIDHWDELARSLEPESPVRFIMLNARQNRITKTMHLNEIEAELERLGA